MNSGDVTLVMIIVAGTVAEQVMLLENIGTSVLVSKDQVICNAFLAKNIVEEDAYLVRVGAMCSFFFNWVSF